MEHDIDTATRFGRAVVDTIQDKNVPFMAAGIAYQAFISLLPLVVLTAVLVSLVGDEAVAATVADTTEGFLPESGRDLVEDAIAGAAATTGTSIIGLVILLWGSLKIFRGLDTAFSVIYESTDTGSFIDSLRDALVVFVSIVTALLAVGIGSVVFAYFPQRTLIGLLNPILLVVGLTVAFFPMYYYFPDVSVTIRDVLPGVVVAAVGWTALQSLFQVYVAFAGQSDSAGVVGGVLLVLTWLYFGGLILLVGAVVNASRSQRTRSNSMKGTPKVDETPDRSETDPPHKGTPLVERPSRFGRGSVFARDRLEERIERLERERDQLRNDLRAQKSRRYRVEDRATELAGSLRAVQRENGRLRSALTARRNALWKRLLNRTLDNVDEITIGAVRRDCAVRRD